MTPKEIAMKLANAAINKKGEEVRVLEITELTVLADYFVICTGTSTTHIKTIADEMEMTLKKLEIMPHHIEGYAAGGWVLLDFGVVVAHVFMKDTRDFYTLERLWVDAVEVPVYEV